MTRPIRVRGFALPHGEPVDLFTDGNRWTTGPVPNAELVAEGWLLPGLVDAHTHPGAAVPGDPLDHDLLREHLRQHVDAGVTAIRSPGLAADPPAWFGTDPDVPRAWHAGPWLAQHDQFFDGWGRRPAPGDLPAVGDEVVPLDVLTAVVTAVHEVGGRVAVHSQHAAGGAVAVAAGVDSVEHGMCLDPALLNDMAARGTALGRARGARRRGRRGRSAGARGYGFRATRTNHRRGACARCRWHAAARRAGRRVLVGPRVPGAAGTDLDQLAAPAAVVLRGRRVR